MKLDAIARSVAEALQGADGTGGMIRVKKMQPKEDEQRRKGQRAAERRRKQMAKGMIKSP